VELWAKEAPLACRNFVQLAMEGYFENTVIHRIVKDCLVQMGDPTGTGLGFSLLIHYYFNVEITK
jgi:peptidyl-prolyl cis-trans isomerase SDCCAG10